MSDLIHRQSDSVTANSAASQAKTKETFNLSKSSAFALLLASLKVFKEVAGKTPVPGLQEGVKALVIILDAVQKTSQNADEVESFAKRIKELTAMLEKIIGNNAPLSDAMRDRIERLSQAWVASATIVQDIGSQNYIKRLVKHDIHAQAITGQIAAIEWSIHTFMVESTMAIEFMLDDTRTFVREMGARLEKKVDIVQQSIEELKIRQNIHACGLPYAITARFDCNDRLHPCHEGTRTDILDKIHQWIDQTDPLVTVMGADRVPAPHVFWLNGPGSAGTGKTTIAYTVAMDLHKQQKLGASFFCSRDNAECRDPKLIFPTIAYQLGHFYTPFLERVSAVLKADPEVAYSVMPLQLERLIVQPLQALQGTMPPCVIVIDALNECRDGGATSIILSSLAQHIMQLVPLKFLITSRPDHHISGGFELAKLNQVTKRYILHEIETQVVESDIQLYLGSSLKNIKEVYKLNNQWPSKQDVNTLVQLSSGLFIFAATAAKYIQDECYGDPQGQLRLLLEGVANTSSSPYQHLDQLYLQVLNNAFPDISSSLSSRLKVALGSIVFLQTPLSPIDLEQLLGLSIPLQTTLRHLHSVVIFPQNQQDVIQLIHPSFYDFLSDPTRCSNPKFLVNSEMQHSLLAQACLGAMKGLKQNICEMEEPWKLHDELDVPVLVQQHISPVLQYACRHWASHLSHGLLADKLLHLLEEFCKSHLLYWVEVCSLLGELRGVLVALKVVQKLLSATGNTILTGPKLLDDCQRFVGEFFPLLRVASPHMYLSAPAFTPIDTQLLIAYEKDFSHSIKALHHGDISQNWQPCMQTIVGHNGAVLSAAVSADGLYIASSSVDFTARIWDAISGVHQKTLYGHHSEVRCLSWSYDSIYLGTGSDDGVINVWAVTTGELLKMIYMDDGVSSLAFFPNDYCIVAGNDSAQMRVYRPLETAPFVQAPDGASYILESVGIISSLSVSPCSTMIASGSLNKSISLWDVNNGCRIQTLNGHSHSLHSICFSHNGALIASGDVSGMIHVWNVKNKSHIRKIKAHSNIVSSVSFSPHDIHILSSSYDKTVKIWVADSGAHFKTLTGHLQAVTSACFSSDGEHVVSASLDGTTKLWDINVHTQQSNKRKFQKICGLSVSPDGTYIASVIADYTLELWDAITGSLSRILKGHSGKVNSITFSPDSSQLVSGSADNSIRVWNTVTGICVHILNGHTDNIQSVKFLTNDQVVSGSFDRMVQIWDIVTGLHVHTFQDHSGKVYDIAVSSDGVLVVSASQDTTICVWNVTNQKKLHTLYGHSKTVHTVALSPNDIFIASGSWDQTVQLWDINTGAHLSVLQRHCPEVMSYNVHFSHDQQFLIVGSSCLNTGLDTFTDNTEDPVDFQCFPVAYMRNGWITSVSSQHRICWIPHVYCGQLVCTSNRAALATPAGVMIILDLTQLKSHIKTLM